MNQLYNMLYNIQGMFGVTGVWDSYAAETTT